MLNISPKLWNVLSQWTHIFVGGVTGQYLLFHTTSWKGLLYAGLGAILPVIYKWANPVDTFPAPGKGLIAADAAVMAPEATPKAAL